jgi:heme/copper-type cytochrome/quinol oxidase subunit 3
MTEPTAIRVHEGEATNDVRMIIAIAWIAGPTAIFVGWFLQSLIAGSQRDTTNLPETQYGLMLLFAFITSVPLVIVSLIGAGAAIFSDRLRTQRLLNLIALVWSGMVFALYFGLFGAVGTFTKDGFPVTPRTMTSLVIIALLALAVPVVLFLVARQHIGKAEIHAAEAEASDTYDI